MARPNAMRSIEGESNLARRIAIERRNAEWSYEALAKRMTAVGCPINASALYKIEKGDPPRKITVDELLAFAQVFGKHVDDLLTPIRDYQIQRRKEVAQAIEAARDSLVPPLQSLLDAYMDYFDLVADGDDEVVEGVDHQIFPEDLAEQQSDATPLFALEVQGKEVLIDDSTLREGISALHLAVIKQASEAFEAVNPDFAGRMK